MAILFVSPKEKQKPFIWLIILIPILFLAIISFVLFFPGFTNNNQTANSKLSSSDSSAYAIDLTVLNSDEVKQLVPFEPIETEFTYIVKDKNGNMVTGNISADTKDDAQTLLESTGFQVVSLQETATGRIQPFIPY